MADVVVPVVSDTDDVDENSMAEEIKAMGQGNPDKDGE